ncbi:MAG: RNA-directed DNA polymerase [Thermodesulfobacteriota bacterium]
MDVLKRAWHLVRNDARTDFIHDTYRYSDFGFSLEDNLKNIQEGLIREGYYPKPLLEIDVPKSSLAVRPGSVPEIEDRIVTYAIVYLIAPYLDKKLPEGVCSYRLKPEETRDRLFQDHEILKFPFLKKETIQSRIDIVEPWYEQWPKFIEKSKYTFEDQGYKYLTISDIVSYFENISLEILRDEILLKYLPKEQKIINLLMHILEYWTWRSYEGKPVLRGIPQGNDVSSFLGNVYLLPLDEEFAKFSKKEEIKYFRYVDDVKIFSKDESVARECIFIMNDILRKLHLNIQGEKTLILEDQDIKSEIEDERLDRVNALLKEFQKQKNLTKNERIEYIEVLKKKYKKIGTRKKPILGKDLRLFRRLMTAFTLLQESYLIPRALKEIEKNPDSRLMGSVVRYFRCFPNRATIGNKLADFLYSPYNKFAQQEAQVLTALRYARIYPQKLLSYVKNSRMSKFKHWYVRIQSILLLNQLELSKKELRVLLEQYKSEKNIEVKKALIKPLCQLDRDNLNKFFRESVFEKDSKITQVIKMLIMLQEREDKAFSETNSIFNDFREDKLMDEFYKLEIIKFSKTDKVRAALLTGLRSKRKYIRRPLLLKKVKRILEFLEEKTKNTK